MTFSATGNSWKHRGTFDAHDGGRRGIVRVDRQYPFHFVWEGTGEHYFYNSTTAYMLMGVRDEQKIRDAIDRLARLKINRIRVALSPARVKDAMVWFEPVYPSDEFTFLFGPWEASRMENLEDPGKPHVLLTGHENRNMFSVNFLAFSFFLQYIVILNGLPGHSEKQEVAGRLWRRNSMKKFRGRNSFITCCFYCRA